MPLFCMGIVLLRDGGGLRWGLLPGPLIVRALMSLTGPSNLAGEGPLDWLGGVSCRPIGDAFTMRKGPLV